MTPQNLERLLTMAGLGYKTPGPGTWGSVGALPILALPYWLMPGIVDWLILLAAVTGSALVLILADPQEDRSSIVIDEFAGMAVAMFFLHSSLWAMLVALVLFRVFDILKPGPIRALEHLTPPWLGILADDLGAGLAAGLLGLAVMWGLGFVFF